jgi:hypothetical protein
MRTAAERPTVFPFAAALVVGATVTLAPPARAQSTSAAAQALFDEGRRLSREGDVPLACTKFAESQRIEPAGGTLLNLAACHARMGKTATAWAEFKNALEQARRENRDDRVQEATRQIERLEPHLPRLTLVVTAPIAPSLAIRFDGTELGPSSWGTAMPVDPGEHQLSADAPGYLSWNRTASFAADGESRVTVPALAAAVARRESVAGSDAIEGVPSTRASGKDMPPSSDGARGPAMYVFATAALVAGGTGTVFGLTAINKAHAINACNGDGRCADPLRPELDSAEWGADIAFGASAVCLGAAAYLFFTRPPRSSRPAARLAPITGMHSLALVAEGSW